MSNIRHTADIDANWYSNEELTAAQMTKSLQDALNKNNIHLDISLYRMYGENRSAGFYLLDKHSHEIQFSMDIDVNRPVASTKLYEIEGITFRGITPSYILADKILVLSSNKIFRRIKDLIDLFYMSKVFVLNANEIIRIIEINGRTLDSFDEFLHSQNDLKHAYEKFRLTKDITKIEFEDVYQSVKDYIVNILPKN